MLDLARSGAGPSHEFHRIRHATRLPDGSLAVVDEGSAQLRFYSSAGVFLGAVGGRGDGPGEFQRLVNVLPYRGDSLVIFDYWTGRLAVVDTTRRIARLATAALPYAHRLHALSDGRFLLRVHALQNMDTARGRTRLPERIVLLSAGATAGDTVVAFPGYEEFSFEGGSAQAPLSRTGSAAVLNDRVVVSDGEGVVLRTFALDGRLERITRIRGYPLDAPARMRDSIRAALLGSTDPEIIRTVNRQMAEVIPATLPGVVDVLTDSEGVSLGGGVFRRTEHHEPAQELARVRQQRSLAGESGPAAQFRCLRNWP